MNTAVESALQKVRHPTRGESLLEVGILEGVDVERDRVVVELDEAAITPGLEAGLSEAIRRAVTTVDGIEEVTVERVRPDEGSQAVGFDSVDTVVAVASAKGGVGKSTVALQLACAFAADRDAGVFDADVYGPNVATILDADGPVRTDERGFPTPVSVDGLETMSVGYMHDDGPLAWRGSVAHDALTDLMDETAWSDREVLVVDLPPGTGDVVLTTLQEAPIDGVVVVSTPFETSVDDTDRTIDLFERHGVPVVGVVLNMSRFVCDCCGSERSLFLDPATGDGFDVPVLTEVPFDPDLQATPTPGDPPDAFDALADTVLERLEEVALLDVPADAVDVRGLPPEARYEAVREPFESIEPGERFVLRSDRDPTPVREYLAELAGRTPDAFDITVEQHGPDDWIFETTHPGERVGQE